MLERRQENDHENYGFSSEQENRTANSFQSREISATALPRPSVHRGLEFSSARDQTQTSTPLLMWVNDVYCATVLWPYPSLGRPCPVPMTSCHRASMVHSTTIKGTYLSHPYC